MIDEIQVRNLALIREATLAPSSGLTVLTGETGAGKTALLSACKLLMGERADKSTVREGEDALVVSGRFYGVPWEDESGAVEDEVVVSRQLTADGRSRVNINGMMASVGQLHAAISPMLDLCSQHEHQQLLRTGMHVELLDAWAGDKVHPARQTYEQAYEAAVQAREELERVLAAEAASSAKLDEARFILKTIDRIAPELDEYEQLVSDLARAEHAESLAVAANTAYEALSGEGGALDALNSAIDALDQGARYDAKLGEYAGALREAGYVLEDMSSETRAYRDEVEWDPETLMQQQERMSALQGLLRSYGPRMEDVLAVREAAADLVSLVDDAQARQKAARQVFDEAEEKLVVAAEALAQTRAQLAPYFVDAVNAQMARLEMGSAQLEYHAADLERSAWMRTGSQAIEFLFRPGAGMQARPLARIASGGELSRVMLAIKLVLGEKDQVDTLIFDEIDAGVGGATALALAEVLADLAKTHQVLVVTHLAQIAVRGDAHYLVRKSEGDMPETELVLLDEEQRVHEIARMLSGEVTETSLAHAKEMLASAS